MRKIKIAVIAIGLSQLFYWFNLPLAFASSLDISRNTITTSDYLFDVTLSPENTDVAFFPFFEGYVNGQYFTSVSDFSIPDEVGSTLENGQTYHFLLVDTANPDYDIYCHNITTILQYNNCKNSSAYLGIDRSIIVSNAPMVKYLDIPLASSSDLTASVGNMITDIWQLIALSTGLPLGFFAIKGILSLFKGVR